MECDYRSGFERITCETGMMHQKVMFTILTVIACLAGSGCTTTTHQKGRGEQFNQQGVAYLQANDLPKAHAQFVESWKQDPANAETLYNLASTYHRRGQMREAEEYYRKALQVKPDFAVCRHNYYLLLISENRSVEARDDAARWLKQSPRSADALTQVGWLARVQGDQPSAQRHLEQALSVDPHYTAALLEMGKLYQDYHMKDRARSMYARALQVEPQNQEAKALLTGISTK